MGQSLYVDFASVTLSGNLQNQSLSKGHLLLLQCASNKETWVRSLGQEDPWRREWQPTPVFLLGKSHGQRSLVDYSPGGPKELDMTERLTLSLPRRFQKSHAQTVKQTLGVTHASVVFKGSHP